MLMIPSKRSYSFNLRVVTVFNLTLKHTPATLFLTIFFIKILSLSGCASTNVQVPIPFSSNSPKFNLSIEGDNTVEALLVNEIRFQRKNNRELEQISSRNRIARLEKKLILERLHAEGYYDASVAIDLSDAAVQYRVATGEIYRISTLSLQIPAHVNIPDNIFSIQTGNVIRAEEVLSATKTLASYAEKNACLFKINTDYEVILDTSNHGAHLTLKLEDSPEVAFGEIRIQGLSSVDESFLLSRIDINQGDCFSRKQVDTAKLALLQSNLLGSVTSDIGQVSEKKVPITFSAVERRHRTLSVGAGFQTDEGFGISFGWEHRNLMRRAQRLKIDTHIAENIQRLSSDLTIPYFLNRQQRLSFYGDVECENTDAFESTSVDVGAEYSRKIAKHLRAILGSELSFSEVMENDSEESFSLLSFPLSLEYDYRNDPLNPLKGWVASGRIHPHWDVSSSETRFVKSTLAASAYHTFEQLRWQPTLAVRAALGAIRGAEREDVPANIRFYVGGGGSVRGYPFQSLGPLDENTPLGGLSFTELSFEARFRWGHNWGGTLFVDGGFAYENTTPQVDEDLLWGAGLGIRYYTNFAPLRFDFALPLNKRENIDDNFQFYISIGQSF